MGEVSPSFQPNVIPGLAGDLPSSFSTPSPKGFHPLKPPTAMQNVMLTITDCHPEETQDRIVFFRKKTFFMKYVCFEWHFARSHIHFVRVFS